MKIRITLFSARTFHFFPDILYLFCASIFPEIFCTLTCKRVNSFYCLELTMKGKFTVLVSVYVTHSFTVLFQNSCIRYKNQTKSLDFKINDGVFYIYSLCRIYHECCRREIRKNACVTSGFRREEDEKCALLGYYAASSGSFLPKR